MGALDCVTPQGGTGWSDVTSQGPVGAPHCNISGSQVTGWPLRLLASLLLLVPLVLVPRLEINPTHLLNPNWPPHARLHEAWQLATNATIAALALASVWMRDGLARGCVLGAIVSGGFVVAWLTRDLYGGAMTGTSTAALTVLGLDAAVVIMASAFVVHMLIFGWESHIKSQPSTASRSTESCIRRRTDDTESAVHDDAIEGRLRSAPPKPGAS